MPSTNYSRRTLLAAGGTCLVAVAGCTGTDDTTTEFETDEGPADPSELGDDVDALIVRAADADPFVYPDADAAADDDDDHFQLRSTFHVIDDGDADDLVLETTDEDERRIGTFLEETAFDTESIVVDQRTIEDCYERQFLGATASADSVRLEYCQTLKDPTTPCEADRKLMETVFVRLGRPYDEAPTSRGSSESMTCPETVLADDGGANRSGPYTQENRSQRVPEAGR